MVSLTGMTHNGTEHVLKHDQCVFPHTWKSGFVASVTAEPPPQKNLAFVLNERVEYQ